MSVEASGKNMQAVCQAKEVHDKTCLWGGKATEVHLAFFDIERMGWEEGDVICGLTVVGDERRHRHDARDLRRRARRPTARKRRGRGGRRRRRRARARDHRPERDARAFLELIHSGFPLSTGSR